ncbi:hypothetical protein [Rhodovulum visakhapatnamense]|uniref:Uncharacterized protein n=1 Tax=Rhodovulum visakhapatnamense TaxID=364297 RepID=A0ABS1RLY7_9RHOB|nr:hypothetical protein [Rhodovulum visakhapatnamense]MBL3572021.1 hypothetical protein [Rhodovulum visakhapatnamense]MBL3580673.1 hypothetical protein [Rhodovulum visakhapatnamense]
MHVAAAGTPTVSRRSGAGTGGFSLETQVWLALATALTIAGGGLIEIASAPPTGLASRGRALGAICYGSPAFAWFYLMRGHALAPVAVLYASATLIALALLGVPVFQESLLLRDALGIGLALAAVPVMLRGALKRPQRAAKRPGKTARKHRESNRKASGTQRKSTGKTPEKHRKSTGAADSAATPDRRALRCVKARNALSARAFCWKIRAA